LEHHIRLHLTTVAIVVSLGIAVSVITSTAVAARAYQARSKDVVRQNQTITVKGSTRERLQSDRAVWNIGVRGEGKTPQAAFAVLDAAVQRVQQFLKQAGFQDAEIGVCAIDTETQHGQDAKGKPTHEIVGYALTRGFVITTGDVQRVQQSAGRVTELLQDGVLVTSKAPAYYYTKLAQLKIDLLAAASADARARADKIAAATGCRLGTLRDAQMGVLQITRPDSTEVADYGLYDTTTIDKDVTAVVTVTFGIRAD
jgi:hypothetical protein